MATKRYELNEAQWVRISPLLPDKAGDAGRPAADTVKGARLSHPACHACTRRN
ncbi:hypothetical protein [Rhodopseudomonas boonkerdii]|uniref:hypothetical protein n=1 Tax=Rhodopseudomonas boonkerdii TaxID=475937 RepID=UPI003D31FD2B